MRPRHQSVQFSWKQKLETTTVYFLFVCLFCFCSYQAVNMFLILLWCEVGHFNMGLYEDWLACGGSLKGPFEELQFLAPNGCFFLFGWFFFQLRRLKLIIRLCAAPSGATTVVLPKTCKQTLMCKKQHVKIYFMQKRVIFECPWVSVTSWMPVSLLSVWQRVCRRVWHSFFPLWHVCLCVCWFCWFSWRFSQHHTSCVAGGLVFLWGLGRC